MTDCDYEGIAKEIALRGISLAETFEDWTRCAMALSSLGERGRSIFHTISAVSDKYKEAECEKKFSKCLRSTKCVGIATFVYMARKAGIDITRYYSQSGQPQLQSAPIPVQPKPKPQQVKKWYLVPDYEKYISADSVFVDWLLTWSDKIGVDVACEMYQLGATSDRRVIFPRIDKVGRVWDAKIMAYHPDGHRVKDWGVDWMISQRRRLGLIPADYVSPKILFGLHLLWAGFATRNVCIVESCKTAIVGSICYPQFIWMATGGAQCDMTFMLRPVVREGYNVILIPDVGKYELWSEKAQTAIQTFKDEGLAPVIKVDDMMEQRATEDEREQGIDISDWMISNLQSAEIETSQEEGVRSFSPTLLRMVEKNPKLGELIEVLDLTEID